MRLHTGRNSRQLKRERLELAEKLLENDDLTWALSSTRVFHDIKDEWFFNRANHEMFRSLVKPSERYSMVTWKPVLGQ